MEMWATSQRDTERWRSYSFETVGSTRPLQMNVINDCLLMSCRWSPFALVYSNERGKKTHIFHSKWIQFNSILGTSEALRDRAHQYLPPIFAPFIFVVWDDEKLVITPHIMIWTVIKQILGCQTNGFVMSNIGIFFDHSSKIIWSIKLIMSSMEWLLASISEMFKHNANANIRKAHIQHFEHEHQMSSQRINIFSETIPPQYSHNILHRSHFSLGNSLENSKLLYVNDNWINNFWLATVYLIHKRDQTNGGWLAFNWIEVEMLGGK